MADLTQGRHLDGPGLARFVEQQPEWHSRDHRLTPLHKLCIRRWSAGRQASMLKADEVLTALEIPLSIVPEELICCYNNGRARSLA